MTRVPVRVCARFLFIRAFMCVSAEVKQQQFGRGEAVCVCVCGYDNDCCGNCMLIIISYLVSHQVIGATAEARPLGRPVVWLFSLDFRPSSGCDLLPVRQIYTLSRTPLLRKVFKFKLGKCHVQFWWQDFGSWNWHWLAGNAVNLLFGPA